VFTRSRSEVLTMQEKRAHLEQILRDCGSVLVGYSGGVDSVLLAKVALDVLGPDRMLAVTGKSGSLASWMEDTARDVARSFAIPWLEVRTDELDDPRYAANPSNRCYFCKSELWSKLRRVADQRGLRVLVDGSNADDVGDYRPGSAAGAERSVRSPLQEAGLTKAQLRDWSRELGLPTWDQPAAPCLSSRIPYGIAVNPERLRAIERAELALRRLGLRDFRVRHHDGFARLEIHPAELRPFLGRLDQLSTAVLAAGFSRVALDLDGYRRGSLNEGLAAPVLVQLGAAS
jgi:pyridinium-3,5-biscarboxylic acid mononucleotide sulfurtransferase